MQSDSTAETLKGSDKNIGEKDKMEVKPRSCLPLEVPLVRNRASGKSFGLKLTTDRYFLETKSQEKESAEGSWIYHSYRWTRSKTWDWKKKIQDANKECEKKLEKNQNKQGPNQFVIIKVESNQVDQIRSQTLNEHAKRFSSNKTIRNFTQCQI